MGPTAGPPRASPRASGGSVGLSSLEASGSVSEAVLLMGPQGRRQSKSERQGGCFRFFLGMDVWRIIGVERGSCEWLMVGGENRVLLGRDFVKRPQKM